MSAEYSVCIFFPGDTCEYVARWVEAEEAVRIAADYIRRPAALMGMIRRVIVTDGGDHTTFEWTFGKGITFPYFDPAARRFVANRAPPGDDDDRSGEVAEKRSER